MRLKVYLVYSDEYHKGILFIRVVKMQNEILINGFSISLMYVIFIFIWYWLKLRIQLTYKHCLCFYNYFLKLDYNFWNCNLYTLTFVFYVCFWSHIFYAIDILFHNACRLRMTRHIYILYMQTHIEILTIIGLNISWISFITWLQLYIWSIGSWNWPLWIYWLPIRFNIWSL